MVKRKTARSRLRRAILAVTERCRRNLHRPVAEQHRLLCQKLRGHYAYYGITGNHPGRPGQPGRSVEREAGGMESKEWSRVNCASFGVMGQRDLQDAITTDHHFEQVGFVRLQK